MKFSTIAAIFGSAQASVSPAHVAELFGGFVEGALKEESLGEYVTCAVTDP